MDKEKRKPYSVFEMNKLNAYNSGGIKQQSNFC